LYDYGARFYSPLLGRFISPDSVVQNPSDPQTLNRYSYTRNNPLRYTDPSGHCFQISLFGLSISLFCPILDGQNTNIVDGGSCDFSQCEKGPLITDGDPGSFGQDNGAGITDGDSGSFGQDNGAGIIDGDPGSFSQDNAAGIVDGDPNSFGDGSSASTIFTAKKQSGIRGAPPGRGSTGGPTGGQRISPDDRLEELAKNQQGNPHGRYSCDHCGYENTDSSHFDVDHIVPKSQDGNRDPNNRRLLCLGCNRSAQEKWPPKPGSDWATKHPDWDMRNKK
jgi:hypothetical protein